MWVESVLSGMGEPIKSEMPDDLKLNLILQLHKGQKTVHLNKLLCIVYELLFQWHMHTHLQVEYTWV